MLIFEKLRNSNNSTNYAVQLQLHRYKSSVTSAFARAFLSANLSSRLFRTPLSLSLRRKSRAFFSEQLHITIQLGYLQIF